MFIIYQNLMEAFCFERVDFPQPFIGTDSVPEVIDPFQIVPGRALGLTMKHRLFQPIPP